MVGGKVGPGLGGMGDSESGLAILLNCENIPPPKKSCYSGGKTIAKCNREGQTSGNIIGHITDNYRYFLVQQLQ